MPDQVSGRAPLQRLLAPAATGGRTRDRGPAISACLATTRRDCPRGGLESPDGRSVGSFDTSQLTESRGVLHLHRFDLEGGSLVGLGRAGLDGTYTVVGASGRLAGATGSYTVRDAGDHHEFSFEHHRRTSATMVAAGQARWASRSYLARAWTPARRGPMDAQQLRSPRRPDPRRGRRSPEPGEVARPRGQLRPRRASATALEVHLHDHHDRATRQLAGPAHESAPSAPASGPAGG